MTRRSSPRVLGNIPADFAALWEKVKRGIKGDSRQTRTEAFLKYAEEHPHETYAAIDDVTDRKIREFEAQHAKLRPYAKARKRPYTDAELAAVPF